MKSISRTSPAYSNRMDEFRMRHTNALAYLLPIFQRNSVLNQNAFCKESEPIQTIHDLLRQLQIDIENVLKWSKESEIKF